MTTMHIEQSNVSSSTQAQFEIVPQPVLARDLLDVPEYLQRPSAAIVASMILVVSTATSNEFSSKFFRPLMERIKPGDLALARWANRRVQAPEIFVEFDEED